MDMLSVALLYCKEHCLHFQLAYESLGPKDAYHEEILLNRQTIMISEIYQDALAKIERFQWEGPITKVTKRTFLMLPQCLAKALEYYIKDVTLIPHEKDVTLIPHEIERLPKMERMADVVILVGPRVAEQDRLAIYPAPWIERSGQEGSEIPRGMCPISNRTMNSTEHTRNLHNALLSLASTTRTPKGIYAYPDAEPGEWDYPTRALGYDPYDDNGKIGYNPIRKWINSVRKYWRYSDWLAKSVDKKAAATATSSRKRRTDETHALSHEYGQYPPHWKRRPYAERVLPTKHDTTTIGEHHVHTKQIFLGSSSVGPLFF